MTGAACGLGRAISRGFWTAGSNVLGVDRDREGLSALIDEFGDGRFEAAEVDLTAENAGQALIEAATSKYGSVDILVNCAGVFPSTPALDISRKEWRDVLGLNLDSCFFCSQALAQYLVAEDRSGSIVNVASAAGIAARPGVAHYSASKAGLMMLTKALALEWAEHGIRVNAVAPGVVETAGVTSRLTTEEAVQEHEKKIARIPLGRPAEIQEVVETVTFIASDRSSFVTGHTLVVDGGYSVGHTFRD